MPFLVIELACWVVRTPQLPVLIKSAREAIWTETPNGIRG